MMRGTHVFKKASIEVRPPGCPFAQVVPAAPVPLPSWPSSHRLGVMKTKFGVARSFARSAGSLLRLTTWLEQLALSSMMEWKYMKGSCLVA
jgi:hypothetical protein